MSNSDLNSERKYKKLAKEMELILDNIPELVFYKDAENNLIRVNKYFADSNKLNKKEIEGKSCFDLYSKEQAQAYWDDDLEVINSGKPKLNIVEPWETEDGIRWLNTNKIPIFNEKGKCTGIIGFSTEVTEQVKAKAEIQKLSAYNRNLIEVSLDPLVTIDQDGKIMDINFATETITGHSREELIGTEFSSYFIEPEKATEGYKRVFEMGSVQDYELGLQHVDGHVTPVLFNASIFKNKNGKIMGVFAAARDIANRKKIEEELRESEEKYRHLFETSPYFIGLLNTEGILIDCNDAINIILSIHTRDDAIGKNFKEIFLLNKKNTHLVPIFEKLIKSIFEGVNQEGFDFRLDRSIGGHLWIHIEGSLIEIENQKLIQFIMQDITERKKAEKALKESEARFKGIFESKMIGTFFWDENGEITDANDVYLEMVGYSKDEVLSGAVCWRDLTPPKYTNLDNKALEEIANTGVMTPIEKEYIHKDGSHFPILVGGSALPGSTLGGVSFALDITERKKGEQIIINLLEQLRRINIELEQFAYVASHDLKEPLRMILNFARLLARRYKGKLDEDADDFIDFIVDGAVRMQKLIDALLSYSRIGRSDKQFRLIDVDIILKKVIVNLRHLIEESNTIITTDPLPKLVANEVEFIQLFQNLISNAIKFHGESPPLIHVSAKLQKKQWIFSVRDNGIGIDSKDYKRIFIIFQRLHTKNEYEGTGIGLSICKKILEHHKGKIWVESEVGKGSTFYFSIPKEIDIKS